MLACRTGLADAAAAVDVRLDTVWQVEGARLILRFQAQVVVTIAVTSSGESYVQAQIEVVGRARCYRVLVISITRSIGEHSQTLG